MLLARYGVIHVRVHMRDCMLQQFAFQVQRGYFRYGLMVFKQSTCMCIIKYFFQTCTHVEYTQV